MPGIVSSFILAFSIFDELPKVGQLIELTDKQKNAAEPGFFAQYTVKTVVKEEDDFWVVVGVEDGGYVEMPFNVQKTLAPTENDVLRVKITIRWGYR